MRKANVIITALALILFILHAVIGGFQLMGVGSAVLKLLAWAAFGLVMLHALIGLKLTVDTLRVSKKTGASYFKENRLFWARRLSGFAVMALLTAHITAFAQALGGVYRLKPFSGMSLALQLALAAAVAVHVITNVKPLLISFGVKRLAPRSADVLIVLSLLFVFIAAAFIVYYLRWNVF